MISSSSSLWLKNAVFLKNQRKKKMLLTELNRMLVLTSTREARMRRWMLCVNIWFIVYRPEMERKFREMSGLTCVFGFGMRHMFLAACTADRTSIFHPMKVYQLVILGMLI